MKRDIVIVGTGIAGLATSLSLHRSEFAIPFVIVCSPDWHPMNPNLGQGACCALEDAMVLARKLAPAVISGDPAAVKVALESYERERWPCVFPLTIRANTVGSLLRWENPMVCAGRNNVIIPKVVRLGRCSSTRPSTVSRCGRPKASRDQFHEAQR